MLTSLISLAVAAGGGGMVALAIKQARTKGWAGSLQMAAGGFLLMGLAAIGIVGFLAGLVLNPIAWLGIVSLGIGTALFMAGQRLEGRGGTTTREVTDDAAGKPGKAAQPKAVEGKRSRSAKDQIDDEMAEIEEILRRRGIQ